MNDTTIKFYANYKNKKYFISGKNEKNKYFSLWKNPDLTENKDLYLDTEKFKHGVEIDKKKLKLLPREDGEESKVLVFKDFENEKEFLISKQGIEKRKQQKNKKAQPVEDIIFEILGECFSELLTNYIGLNEIKQDGLIAKCLAIYDNKKEEQELIPTDNEELPF